MKNNDKYCISKIFLIMLAILLTACRSEVPGDSDAVVKAVAVPDAPAALEITADDYARAEQWMRANIFKKVKNLTVAPHWIGDSGTFWYKRDSADGFEFTHVVAASGDKSAAFDHAALAQALTEAGEEDVKANELPFDSFEFSPDQNTISFKIDDKEYDCALAGMACSRGSAEPVSGGILVAPDGEFGVYTKQGNLHLIEIASGLEKPLTSDGEPHYGYGIYYGNWKAAVVPRARNGGDENHPPMEAKWAPDSRHILVTRLDERHVAEYHWLETVPGDGSFRPILHTARVPLTGEREAEVDWFVIDTQTGSKVRLELPYEELFDVHQDMLAIRKHWWSDDYSRLWALTWGDTLKSAHLFEIDLATGRAREAVAETMHPRMDTNTTSYNPPNVWVVNNFEQAIWFSQRSGWGHLYLYDLASGEEINSITSGDWLMRDIIRVDDENDQIYFTATHREGGDPYYRYLYRVNFDGSALTLLTPETSDHMIESPYNDVLSLSGTDGSGVLSPDNRWIVYDYSKIDEPTQSAIRNAQTGELVAVFEQADATELYADGWRIPEAFVAKAEDGITDLYGVIYRPANFSPLQSYPVIDSQYASPLTAVVPHNFPATLFGVPAAVRTASLGELGFVAVSVDARGTAFRDRAFSHQSWQNLHQIGLYDHIAVIKQLAETRPWMDISRIGIHGGSYGGFTAFRAMLEYPEFYKVGISNAGMGNLQTMYPDYHWEAFHGEAYYDDESLLKPSPSSKPVNYMNNDVTEQAAKLQGKLMIMLGELDENVLPATTLAFVAELVEQDIDFDMVYLPNRPHRFGSVWAVRKMWNYLVENLHDQDPPEYKMTKTD